MSEPTVQPSNGQAIEYKAFARPFEFGSNAAVLYVFATCYYPVGGYRIFLQQDGADRWELMEVVPEIFNDLVTYYVASGTTSQPLADPPSTITVVDARGEHTVPVEPWSFTVLSATAAAKSVVTPG